MKLFFFISQRKCCLIFRSIVNFINCSNFNRETYVFYETQKNLPKGAETD